MPKFTLLEMTQKVLSAIDGDEVNSITDTVESEQVVEVIERSYWQLIDNKYIPEHLSLLTLSSPSDSSKPTHLFLPTGVDKLSWIRYNVIKDGGTDINYVDIPYVSQEEFLNASLSLSSTGGNIQSVDINGTPILIKNDAAPSCWTSFDDEFMVFNSFDSLVDSTLQPSKTMAYGAVEPVWTVEDTFTPDMDGNLFTALLNDSISMAFIELKQQEHGKAESNARKSRAKQQRYRENFRSASKVGYQNYGR